MIKAQCVIDEDFEDDDVYLEHLGTVAEQLVEKEIDRSIDEVVSEEGKMPYPLLQAMLLYVDFLYGGDRGSSGQEIPIPPAISRVCQLYRRY